MKKPLRITLLILVLLVVVLSFAVYALATGADFGKMLFPKVFRTDTASSVEGVLERTAPLKRLDLAAMTVKVVFPQDLYPEGYDWKGLERKKAALSIEEERLRKLFVTAKGMGIDLTRPVKKFLVLTFDIVCSVELSKDSVSYKIILAENDSRRIMLTLKKPAISSITQRDMTAEEYAYPEVDIFPGDLAEAVELSMDYARRTALEKKLPEAAAEKGRAVFTELMNALSFSEVDIGYTSE